MEYIFIVIAHEIQCLHKILVPNTLTQNFYCISKTIFLHENEPFCLENASNFTHI